jgi:hypothetical protein
MIRGSDMVLPSVLKFLSVLAEDEIVEEVIDDPLSRYEAVLRYSNKLYKVKPDSRMIKTNDENFIDGDVFLSIEEVVNKYHFSRETIRKLCAEGEFYWKKSELDKRKKLILESSIRDYIGR